MSFVGIESKASKEEGKKSKKAKPAPEALLCLGEGTASPRQRESFVEVKLKTKDQEPRVRQGEEDLRRGEEDLCRGKGRLS